MHGKVWMFSHLIDDEDLAFMEKVEFRFAHGAFQADKEPVVKIGHIVDFKRL